MIAGLLSVHLITGPVPLVVFIIGAAAAIALLVTPHWRRWLPIAAGALVIGFLLGLLLCWFLGDLLNLFGVDLSVACRLWFASAVAGIALAVARMIFSGVRWVAGGIASIVVFALVGGLGINIDLGEFPTVKTALGVGAFGPIELPVLGGTTSLASWSPPAQMPAHGRLGSVSIPATVSHFRARRALVYLPPAALVPDPPRLPVFVLLSGQPGSPSDLFTSGQLKTTLDALAKAHRGLAPIVVVPDQLGAPARNPMCVDSALGNAATYLTVDVPRWITAHLGVLSGAKNWGIGGFSAGGTCAIQFGAAYPAQFGTILDISGQVVPANGSVTQTIQRGFGGSRTAYEAAAPLTLMRENRPYSHTLALFSAGDDDLRYGPGLQVVAAAAKAAGMDTHVILSPGTAHDWNTVQFAFTELLPIAEQHWHLDE